MSLSLTAQHPSEAQTFLKSHLTLLRLRIAILAFISGIE
jgi:hypothetical protein